MNGKCVIFSAPSGAGKTTIVHHLLKQNLGLEFSVSATSRAKRDHEEHGKDYYFLSVEEFKSKIAEDAFFEWEEVYANQFYGTLKSEIERIWANGKHVIFDVDVIGGLNLKKVFGEQALAIFVQPPSIEHLEERLRNRETDTPESIAKRIGKAEQEMQTAHQFDCILINDQLGPALAEAETIVGGFLTAAKTSLN
jgi:guanylate kinase